ncbi:hypothetical protein HSX37_11195|uniref:hypothetical protein n=1 Tax=Dendrosporobacter quercicolus TaxID=146817 RepID=UPI000B84C4AB|nr:hypothetical protein [Dendrosporobacter quercicolus]NSL48598.1 hypothetical protein [Dendrosporobacter quercicolus DSM 1736]
MNENQVKDNNNLSILIIDDNDIHYTITAGIFPVHQTGTCNKKLLFFTVALSGAGAHSIVMIRFLAEYITDDSACRRQTS